MANTGGDYISCRIGLLRKPGLRGMGEPLAKVAFLTVHLSALGDHNGYVVALFARAEPAHAAD